MPGPIGSFDDIIRAALISQGKKYGVQLIADEDPFEPLRISPVPPPSPGAKEKAVHKGISSLRAAKGVEDLKKLVIKE